MELGKTNKTKMKESTHATLFVSMQNPKEKRKAILYSIKNALVIQEEYEKIMQIRANKKKVLDQIKKSLASLNTKYQGVKKAMPNVKNVISFTEKEFMELDRQVAMIGSGMEADSLRLSQDKHMMKTLKGGKQVVAPKKKVAKKDPKNMTKSERIQYNLDLINQRLKSL